MRRVERNIVIVVCRGNLYSNLRKPAEQQSEMEISFLRHQCTGECTEFHKTIDIIFQNAMQCRFMLHRNMALR